jgi:predicted GNAT family acetyltransferase
MVSIEFLDDPAVFLATAADRLAADPVLAVVVTRVTSRIRDDDAAGIAPPADAPRWWALLREDDELVGLAMRTAPFAPFPPYLLPMPVEPARQLARTLHDRGEPVAGANGALPAVEVFAAETARLAGGVTEVAMHMRLFELEALDATPVAPVPGRLRPVRLDEVDLARAWLEQFMADADDQAGREPGSSPREVPTREQLARRLRTGTYWFWEDGGRPVNITVGSTPAFGVAGVGPVFTPKDCRGHGYASAAVAEVSRRLLEHGARVCLFTDQANPTSNRIYQRLGFRPVTDTANLHIRPPRRAP